MMAQKGDANILQRWSNLIRDLQQNGDSASFGIFDYQGNLLCANSAFCYFMDTDLDQLLPRNSFILPSFAEFVNAPKSNLVYEGLITIGNFEDVSYVLNAEVFRHNNEVLVYAEADVPNLFQENKKMCVINQEVNNLQRQLIKEKKNLQNALLELKETQQMLIHSEKMNALGKLVAGVAHELNNPISFVYSNIFSLEKNVKELVHSYRELEELIHQKANAEIVEASEKIGKKNEIAYLLDDVVDITKESKMGIERVKNIIEDLRKFSRLDESEIKEVNIIENIQSTITIARFEITKKNIKFQFIGPSNLLVECYVGQLNQAVLNVLINAIYAVDEGGFISFTVTSDIKNVNLVIKDDGCGISDDVKNHIFDPFFTTKPVGSGTGLGLSITYKIITDLHHGTILVESASGQGSTFRISIPLKI